MAMYRRRVWVGLVVVAVCTTGGAALIGWSLVYSGVVRWGDFSGTPLRPGLADLPHGPQPHLSPEQVVQIQLWALRANDEDDSGIVRAFQFASPANQSVTGPVERFAAMIHRDFPVMLGYEMFELGRLVVRGHEARQAVAIFSPDGTASLFIFVLSRQVDGPCRGCWMTESVTPVPVPDEAEDYGEPV